MALFSFKKNEERMAPPKVAKPVPVAGKSSPQGPASLPPLSVPPPEDDLESLDFTGITLEDEKDPIDAAAEEAAIAYAKCEAVLKESIHAFAGFPGTEVLWLMLFDIFRMTNQRDAFTQIELEYAKRFEKQPPVWKNMAEQRAASGAAAGAIAFKGDLVAANAAGFDSFRQAIEAADKPLRFDFAKVKAVDPAGCERLLEALARGKKLKRSIDLLGIESLIKLLDPLVKAKDTHQPYWKVLLECYQRQAKQEVFDEVALDFAVAFELSPPAYEAPPASAKKAPAAAKPAEAPKDDAFYLSGELLGGSKIDGMDAFIGSKERVVIDMSGVIRIDFSCAGVMFSSLRPACMRGVSITLRYPNYLVAALLKVVGLADIATIVNAKI
jgi:ABC-type transporter Mla MlaB component